MTTETWDPYAKDLEKPNGLLGSKWMSANLAHDIGFAMSMDARDSLLMIYLGDKPEWARIKVVLKEYGQLRDVERAVRGMAQGVGDKGEGKTTIKFEVISEIYPDAPVAKGAEVPLCWHMDGPGFGPVLWRLVGDDQHPVAYSPLVISALLVGVPNRNVSVELAWLYGEKWHKRVVPRETVKNPRDLVTALAGCEGFPCDSNTAKWIVSYLTDYEAHNQRLIPHRRTTSQMGWVPGGEHGFVAGPNQVGGREPVEYVPRSSGELQLTRGVTTKGSAEAWADAIASVADRPRIMFAVYAALATPLLKPLGADCFAVDLANKTSSGKTTALRIAASAWGNHEHLVASWDSTTVGFERRAAAMSGLPIFADDTKRAKKIRGESIVPGVVYQFASGTGRVRGAIKGLDETQTWSSILLSTGEQRILDMSKDGGVAGRVITLWGPPFGRSDVETANLIRRVSEAISAHHGHAGLAVAKWLAEQRSEWETLRRQHATICDNTRARLEASVTADQADLGVINRLSVSLAVVQLAGEVVHRAMDLPWEFSDPALGLLDGVASGAGVADREKEALRYVVSWATQHRARFCTSETHRSNAEPGAGWLGFWEEAVGDTWEFLAVWPDPLRIFLEAHGFESKAIVRQWREHGWLITDSNDRATAKVGELTGRPRLVKIARAAMAEHGDLGDAAALVLPF